MNIQLNDFIRDLQRLYNHIKQNKLTLPEEVLAFKLLDASKIPHRDLQLVLTGVDYYRKIFLSKLKLQP